MLTTATLAVAVGGYGWLGYAAGDALGALVGCAAGLALSGLLHVLIELAMSGMPPRNRSRSRPHARRSAH
ncbi:hypothetical protein AB0N14_05270 [Streptomyces sp. NPDC051104]|uniref:hypothetical protein n=1 Tax=Streptomyces sp. NPDC051104 TaxID=3155044 RepID=UPI003436D501